MSVYVCLSVRQPIYGTTGSCPIFTKFLYTLPMSVARSSAGGVAIGYVLPVLMDDVIFAHNDQKRQRGKDVHSKWLNRGLAWIRHRGVYSNWSTRGQHRTPNIYDCLVIVAASKIICICSGVQYQGWLRAARLTGPLRGTQTCTKLTSFIIRNTRNTAQASHNDWQIINELGFVAFISYQKHTACLRAPTTGLGPDTLIPPSRRHRVYIGWQWRNFVPYLCQLIIAAILQVKLWEMFVTAIALKYALLISQWWYGHFLKLTDSILFE